VFACKRKIVCWVATLSLMLVAGVGSARADTVSCDFASEAGSSIEFNGTNRTFEFPTTSTYDFVITTATSPILGGLQGNIGGTFTVGTINAAADGGEQADVRQHAGIGLPAPRCRPLDDAVGLGSGGYFVSCVLPYVNGWHLQCFRRVQQYADGKSELADHSGLRQPAGNNLPGLGMDHEAPFGEEFRAFETRCNGTELAG